MDRRHLSLAREAEARFDLLIPPGAEAMLLVEQEGRDQVEVRGRLRETVDHVRRRQKLAQGVRQTFDPAEMDFFWSLSDKSQPWLSRMKGSARPVPVVDDVAVPPEILPEFLVTVQNVLKRQQVIASTFCHAGHGQFHILPFLDLADPEDLRKMRRLADDLYQEVIGVGGTISGEHACGLSRTPYVKRQFGDLVEVFRKVKWIFDPQGILNPGKVVGDDPDLMLKNLRPAIAAPQRCRVALRARGIRRRWPAADAGPAGAAAQLGPGAGGPRGPRLQRLRRLPGPGRGRADVSHLPHPALGRSLAAGEGQPDPRRVDRRAAAIEPHQRRVQAGRRPLRQLPDVRRRVPGPGRHPQVDARRQGGLRGGQRPGPPRPDHVAAGPGQCPGLPRKSAGQLGLEEPPHALADGEDPGDCPGRKLPRVASRTFLRRAARRKLTRPARRSGRRAAYFVDLYANYHDPQLAEATVAVLEHNGVSVYVPPEQVQAGTAAISCGALDIARQLARQNVAVLAEAVRQGYQIVATEPAAALSLIREYPNLLDDVDVRLVADNTSEVCTYLWRMHTQGKLQLDLHPIYATLGYHAPCRLKALGVGLPGERLLRLIPGLSIEPCEEGCSGMAGTYGLRRENFRASLRAGLGLIGRLRDPSIEAGTTECSTCKMQMEQGIRKPTIHPIKLLALSYGIMPELATLLTAYRRGAGRQLGIPPG